ncbi:ABC transporter substrate-binding protein [Austwickia chelonae]|uniref:ABC transporter substrate-binding protein n=1 Tax=Austwickia chelonae TaxID=100225 RepID=UPI0013C2C58D|nr:ABC transporter substrate-binding protein [Austwickia chelonae]
MRSRTRSSLVAVTVLGCLLTTACSSSIPSVPPSDGAGASSGAYPKTVKSCDEQLTFTKSPEKVLIMDDTDLSILAEMDLLDKVVGRSGKLRTAPYDESTLTRIKKIPEIASSVLDSGGTQVATETVIASGADLVIGFDAGIDRDALRKAGIPVYAPVSFCPDLNPEKAAFELVNNEITKVADIFGVPEKGRELTERMNSRIGGLTKEVRTRGSVAVLYVMPGSRSFYAYGRSSMVQPIVEVNGFTNVYGQDPQRVFDGSMEDLLAKNPDHLILLYGEGKSEEAEPTLMSFQGAEKLSAVVNKKVITMAYSLTDPPTPNSVKGATVLDELARR